MEERGRGAIQQLDVEQFKNIYIYIYDINNILKKINARVLHLVVNIYTFVYIVINIIYVITNICTETIIWLLPYYFK